MLIKSFKQLLLGIIGISFGLTAHAVDLNTYYDSIWNGSEFVQTEYPYTYDFIASDVSGDVVDVGIYWADTDGEGILTDSAIGGVNNGSAIGWYMEIADSGGSTQTYYTMDTTSPTADTVWYSTVTQTGGELAYSGAAGTASELGAGSVDLVPSGSPEAGTLATFSIALSMLFLQLIGRRRKGAESGFTPCLA